MKKIHRKILVVTGLILLTAVVVTVSVFVPPLALLGIGLGYAVGVTLAKDIRHWAFSSKKNQESEDDINICDLEPDNPLEDIEELLTKKREPSESRLSNEDINEDRYDSSKRHHNKPRF